jgi:hypothetical protein
LEQAHALASESVARFRAQKSDASLAEVLVTLGYVLSAQGKTQDAYAAISDALKLAWVAGPRLVVAAALEGLAVTIASADADEATRLLSAAASLRRRMGTPLRPADQPAVSRALAAVRSRLGDDRFAALWQEASEQPLEQRLGEIISDRLSAGIEF